MRAFKAGVVAATVLAVGSSSAFGFDPIGQGGQRSRPPAAVVYFKLTLDAATADDRLAYGLALTAPTLARSGTGYVPMADSPKLLDLRFNGAAPDTLRVFGTKAWARDPSQAPGDPRVGLFGGLAGFVLGLATTAAVGYGVYTLVKKKCPAISTITGGCVTNN